MHISIIYGLSRSYLLDSCSPLQHSLLLLFPFFLFLFSENSGFFSLIANRRRHFDFHSPNHEPFDAVHLADQKRPVLRPGRNTSPFNQAQHLYPEPLRGLSAALLKARERSSSSAVKPLQ